jgi:hypothetical protein
MKVYLNPSTILLCECLSTLYCQINRDHIYAVCLSPACEDFNVQKIIKQVEIPYALSPTKVSIDAFGNLDLGEQEQKRQQEEQKKLAKENREMKDLRMFSG